MFGYPNTNGTARRESATTFDRLRLAVLADDAVGVSFYESRGLDRVETHDCDLGEGLAEHVYEKRP